MVESIVAFVIQVLTPLLGLLLNKINADQDAKQKFLDFVQAINKKENVSVKLHKSYQEQLEKLKDI